MRAVNAAKAMKAVKAVKTMRAVEAVKTMRAVEMKMKTWNGNGSETRAAATMPSPIGELLLVAEGDRLTELHLDAESGRAGAAGRLAFRGGRLAADGGAAGVLRAAIEQLEAYFAGELRDFDLPLALRGTPFQRRVWAELQRIAYGQTISYGELARRIGQPTASRAVGLANGRNPIALIVPCHRVIATGGKLGGYGGGLDRKRWLLEHEARRAPLL